jgi:hypothetical protein
MTLGGGGDKAFYTPPLKLMLRLITGYGGHALCVPLATLRLETSSFSFSQFTSMLHGSW